MRVAIRRRAIEPANRIRSRDLRLISEKAKPGTLPAGMDAGVNIVDFCRRRGDKVVLQRFVVELHRYHGVARIVSGRQVLAHERHEVVEA